MASAEPDTPEAAGERRGFIKFFCAFIGTLISVVPFGAGIWAYLDPLAKREGDPDEVSDIAAKLEKYIGVAKGEVNRLDYIVTQFLQAIRPGKPKLKKNSLN